MISTPSLPTTRPWRPLVPAHRVDRIEAVLEDIAEALWRHRESLKPNLASGAAGAALFLGHLSRRPGWQHQEARAMALLESAVARIGEVPYPGYFSGFTGIAWCVEQLRKNVFPPEDSDPNTDVDELLIEGLDTERWEGDYDLIAGLVGIGVYALERLPLASGRTILGQVVRHLEALAIPRGSGLIWPTPPEHLPDWQRDRCPQGYLNLGLAHGTPGVLALLAAAQAQGVEAGRCARLLVLGMAALRGFIQDPAIGVYLPTWCPMELERPAPSSSRLAWCYGDLGASLAFWQAAGPSHRRLWKEDALAMARLAAERPLDQSGVRDAGICHGSAGNLHIFNRWYQTTGDPVFRDAALAYLELTLAYLDPARGFAGVWAYALATEEHPQDFNPDPSLLEGAAGVGIVLLSCLGGPEPIWDRFLMLSSPSMEDPG